MSGAGLPYSLTVELAMGNGGAADQPGPRPFGMHIEGMGDPAFNYRALPIEERLRLVGDIWDSIAEEANVNPDVLPLTEAQRAELDRRIADADVHPEDAVPWEQVRAELFKRGG